MFFRKCPGPDGKCRKHFENDEPTHEMKRRYTHPDKYTAISAVIIGLCFGLVALSNGAAVGEGIGAGIAILGWGSIATSGWW